jgi:hypothetical protein
MEPSHHLKLFGTNKPPGISRLQRLSFWSKLRLLRIDLVLQIVPSSKVILNAHLVWLAFMYISFPPILQISSDA